MRLDAATDFSDIRVQCLGKEYHATPEAWNCLHEVQKLRKDWYENRDHSINHERVFNALEQLFVDDEGRNNHERSMLVGFGLTGTSDQTAQERLNEFKRDLHLFEPPPAPSPSPSLSDIAHVLVRDVKHIFGY